jgi:hypothetical protein
MSVQSVHCFKAASPYSFSGEKCRLSFFTGKEKRKKKCFNISYLAKEPN